MLPRLQAVINYLITNLMPLMWMPLYTTRRDCMYRNNLNGKNGDYYLGCDRSCMRPETMITIQTVVMTKRKFCFQELGSYISYGHISVCMVLIIRVLIPLKPLPAHRFLMRPLNL